MRTDQSRFDRVLAHPDYASAPEQPVMPADAGLGIAEVVMPLMLSVFGIVFLLIAVGLLVDVHAPLVVTILFIGVALIFVVGGVKMSARLVDFRNAPISRVVAVIVKERTEVSGGGENSQASTTYFATLQTRDSERIEYLTYRSLVGRLAVDDIGVAYVKANTLVEFIRFDVD
jgi:hypothetical protein